MKKIFIITLLVLSSCTYSSDKEVKEFLERQGYTNVRVGSYAWVGCAEGEGGTKFFATNSNKVEIQGCLCEGLFKAKTIRFY